MKATDQTEYIVQCIRESGAMYEEGARAFLAEHDGHVRAEAVAERDAEVVAWLVKKSREGFPGADVLASKVARGAVRPDNLRTLPADFFEPGRTYSYNVNGYTAPELIVLFLPEYIARHPERGHRRAIGWSKTGEPGAKWHGDFYEEFDGWAEVTEDGAS